MAEPAGKIKEVYLEPGDFCFGEGNLRITTVLGSCVSITLWHPLLKHGGMCHYMLPSRNAPHTELNGKYGDEAIELFMRELKKRRTVPGQYHVRLYGGGKMFDTKNSVKDIGCLNIEKAHQMLDQYGFNLIDDHIGSYGRRRLAFDVWSGEVRLVHVDHRSQKGDA